MRPSQLQSVARDFWAHQKVSARTDQEESFLGQNSFRKAGLFLGLLTAGAHALGCGGGGAGFVASSSAPPPPAPPVSVNVSPTSANVLLGNTQAFSARVNGTNSAAVTWSVNGVPGGNAALGAFNLDKTPATGALEIP